MKWKLLQAKACDVGIFQRSTLRQIKMEANLGVCHQWEQPFAGPYSKHHGI